MKKFCPVSKLTLPWHHFRLFPHILSLVAHFCSPTLAGGTRRRARTAPRAAQLPSSCGGVIFHPGFPALGLQSQGTLAASPSADTDGTGGLAPSPRPFGSPTAPDEPCTPWDFSPQDAEGARTSPVMSPRT